MIPFPRCLELIAADRSWAIPCTGRHVYALRYRPECLGKIQEAGVCRRAELCYRQFNALRLLRQEVRCELLVEAKKHSATKLLREIPFIGPIRFRSPCRNWYKYPGWSIFLVPIALTFNPRRLFSHLRLMVYDWGAIEAPLG